MNDLVYVQGAMFKAVRCMIAVRRTAKAIGRDFVELADMEREFRQAAVYLEKAIEKRKAEGKPLVL